MKKIMLLGCLIAVIFISACGNSTDIPGVDQIEDGIDDTFGDLHQDHIGQVITTNMNYDELVKLVDEQLVTGNKEFGLSLFRALIEDTHDDNVFISPLSVSIALAMTYNGADAETKEEMAQTLQLGGLSFGQINEGYNVLKQLIEAADPSVELSIANSLWAREGLLFKEDFMQRNKDYYMAEVSALDFSEKDAEKTINNWVDQHTAGKINKIVDGPISEDTILFLINAIYFKGDWTKPFEEEFTVEQDFYLNDGSIIRHPLMSQFGSFYYLDNEDFQAIRLPYGKEENLSMLVFLPDAASDLPQFYNMLSPSNWNKWMAEFKQTPGSIQLPKFTIEYEESLNDVLSSLGMVAAFDKQKANFDNMITGAFNVYIDEVKHKSFIEVNEIGTEAAAVTSVEAVATSMPTHTFNMTVDRPFFFTIVDESTHTILFMGSVEKPEQSE